MLEFAKKIIFNEAKALEKQAELLDENFLKALALINQTKGKIIISGIGKSGIIAKKIVATFSSLSISSLFLCPFNALHGDIGVLQKEDCLILISNSGSENAEFKYIIEYAKNLNINIVSITSNLDSFLAKNSNVSIQIVAKDDEILIIKPPYISTTLTLAIGDALAFSLFKMKNLKKEDFLKNHPAGELGKNK